jgi:16S rRNA (guanine527-N7)-methyltransferase
MSKPTYKDKFYSFLMHYQPDRADELLGQFDAYLELLFAQNQMVNMVSRQTPKDDYWLYHFLDSLLIIKCMDLQAGDALDFGSGGGLPGIPLKLVFPEMKMTLLDSVGKKVKCMQSMIAQLELKDCTAIWARIEDYTKVFSGKRFDYIFCRSVRLEESFIEPLYKLLRPCGRAVFYKAHQAEDVTVFRNITVFDVSLEELGKRQIINVPRNSLEQYLKNRKLG